jgi:hypothetical protein
MPMTIVEIKEILGKMQKIYHSLEIDDLSEETVIENFETVKRYQMLIEDELRSGFKDYPVDFILETFHFFGDQIMIMYDPTRGYCAYDLSNFIEDIDCDIEPDFSNFSEEELKKLNIDKNNIGKINLKGSMYRFIVQDEGWAPTVREALWKWLEKINNTTIIFDHA